MIFVTQDHNHGALNDKDVEALKVHPRFREMVKTSEDKTLNAVTRNLYNVSADANRILPQDRKLHRIV